MTTLGPLDPYMTGLMSGWGTRRVARFAGAVRVRARVCALPRVRGLWPEALAGAAALGWFLYLGYGNTLPPRHLAWMFRSDWFAYLSGFLFYRNAPWGLPLGNTPGLAYPFGTSVAFTDANPLASALLKAAFGFVRRDFQPFGAWFLLCFVLQGVIGTRLARGITRDELQAALGGCLFALTPILPVRHPHIALCGLFFVTAGVSLHVRRLGTRAEVRGALRFALLMVAWASGTHGYLSVMLLALVLAFAVRLAVRGACSLTEVMTFVVAVLGVTFGMYRLVGYLGSGTATQIDAWGFGVYSADLTALWNPQGWSHLWSGLPFDPPQWEGFAYLGAGVLGLLSLSLGLACGHPRRDLRAVARQWPLLAALLVMAVYALSDRVTYLGKEVYRFDSFYARLGSLTGVFRSSGRFLWPLHLGLLAWAVRAAGALPGRVAGRAALTLAVALQAYEFDPKTLDFTSVPLKPLEDPAWRSAQAGYRHLALVPAQIKPACHSFDEGLTMRMAYEAYRSRLTFNSGYIMRVSAAVLGACGRHLERSEPLDGDTIYVVTAPYLGDFQRPDARCGKLDGLDVCVANDRATALRDSLPRRR